MINHTLYRGYSKADIKKAYEQGRADTEADAENRMQSILDDEKRLSYQQGRADAIDECINTLKDFCGGLPNNNLINALEQLKSQDSME